MFSWYIDLQSESLAIPGLWSTSKDNNKLFAYISILDINVYFLIT